MPDPRHARMVDDLRRHGRGGLLEGPEALAPFSHDFGGMVQRRPAALFRPSSDVDVVTALRVAAEHRVGVTMRGAGHSQSGQGLGAGLVLDTTGLDRVLAVRFEEGVVEVEGGACWRKVVDATMGGGMLPRSLTHALDPTVGGTLSVAGVGGEAHGWGAHVDNVLSLDVATVSGEVFHCSRSENRSLFDAVRAGLGQCGVILRARYPLRPCKRFVSTQSFAYRRADTFLQDAVGLANRRLPGLWLGSTLAREPRGRRRLLVLRVGQECDEGLEEAPAHAGLRADFADAPHKAFLWTTGGMPRHGFFHLFGGARPGELNPWVEHVLSLPDAAAALDDMLENGGAALEHGRVGIIFVRRGVTPAPLFMVPEGDMSVGVGVFASFGAHERDLAEATMASHVESMRRFGGKRYLSGYLGSMSRAAWAEHFGATWEDFRAAKRRHDAQNLLNTDFIDWR